MAMTSNTQAAMLMVRLFARALQATMVMGPTAVAEAEQATSDHLM